MHNLHKIDVYEKTSILQSFHHVLNCRESVEGVFCNDLFVLRLEANLTLKYQISKICFVNVIFRITQRWLEDYEIMDE